MTSQKQLLTAAGVSAAALALYALVDAHGGPYLVGIDLAHYAQRGVVALAVVTYQ